MSVVFGMSFIQYGKQTIEEEDIEAVVEVLRENKYLTTGPRVREFEDRVCELVGAKYGIAVSSGTAGLHAAMHAIGIKEGDEVICPAISFAATSNCVLYCGGTPVFCDIEKETMNIDANLIEDLITEKTRAIIMVDFAGQPADYHMIRKICDRRGLILVEDAAHTIGLQVKECPRKLYVGAAADLTVYSFHPVKNMTTGEGGMVMTNSEEYAHRMRQFRHHGVNVNYQERRLYEYDVIDLGYNYRITDLQCALGISQLRRVTQWIARRQEIAKTYDLAFESMKNLFLPLKNKWGCAYHIYVIQLQLENLDCDRDTIFKELKDRGIGVNVHYRPIYLFSYYLQLGKEKRIRAFPGMCPVAEDTYQKIITLPLFPTLTEEQINRVIQTVSEVIGNHQLT